MIEIELKVNRKIISENVQRMGIPNKRTKTLYPSAYVVKRDNKFYLAHFKELLAEDSNGYDNLSPEDLKRLNSIAYLIYNWNLVDLDLRDIEPHDTFIFVLPHKEKQEWTIKNKINTFVYEN